jgi:hypothetical protein
MIVAFAKYTFYQMLGMLRIHEITLRNRGTMVFNVIFNNISVISWRWILLADETRVPGESHQPVAYIALALTL